MSRAQSSGRRDYRRIGRILNDPRSISFGLRILKHWSPRRRRLYFARLSNSRRQPCNHCARTIDRHRSSMSTAWWRPLVYVASPEAYAELAGLNSILSPRMMESLSSVARDRRHWGVALGSMRGSHRAKASAAMEASIARSGARGYRAESRISTVSVCARFILRMSRDGKTVVEHSSRAIHCDTRICNNRGCVECGSRALVGRVRQNPAIDPNGDFIGRCEMILGLLYKAKKKRALAEQHLTEAKRIVFAIRADADAGEDRGGVGGAGGIRRREIVRLDFHRQDPHRPLHVDSRLSTASKFKGSRQGPSYRFSGSPSKAAALAGG